MSALLMISPFSSCPLSLRLPEDDSGLALLEVYQETAAGMVVSFPEAMLVTNDEEVAEELSNGLRNRPAEQVESVLRVRTPPPPPFPQSISSCQPTRIAASAVQYGLCLACRAHGVGFRINPKPSFPGDLLPHACFAEPFPF